MLYKLHIFCLSGLQNSMNHIYKQELNHCSSLSTCFMHKRAHTTDLYIGKLGEVVGSRGSGVSANIGNIKPQSFNCVTDLCVTVIKC